jgi:predicted dehydrogenase
LAPVRGRCRRTCRTSPPAETSWNQIAVRAIGSEGQIHIDLEREIAWLWKERGRTDIRLELPPDAGAYDCDGPPNVLIDLAHGRDVVNESPGELGARTVEILEAAYRSARSGRLEAVAGAPR